ncbi:hypothetical protein D3C76_1321530 [compost metagenome]
MGSDNADARRGEALQAFGKQRQAVQPALHRLFAEHVVGAQAVSQVDALFQSTDDLHCAINLTGNDHVEAVRTKVDRSKLLRSWGLIVYRHRLIGLLE